MDDMTQLAEVVEAAIRALPLSDEVRVEIGVEEGGIAGVTITGTPPTEPDSKTQHLSTHLPPFWQPVTYRDYVAAPISSIQVTYPDGSIEGGASP